MEEKLIDLQHSGNEQKKKNIFAIISLVLGLLTWIGIISIVLLSLIGKFIETEYLYYFISSVQLTLCSLFNILGTIFGVIGLRSKKRQMAIGGIILSGLPLVNILVFFVLTLFGLIVFFFGESGNFL